MKNSKLIPGLATLAVCALVLPTLASLKHPVTRPDKNHATVTWTVSLINGDAVAHEIGESTHTGRYTSEGVGVWDLDKFTFVSASGVITAANGDQVFWELPGSSYLVEFTGGTGRFENATGGISIVTQSEPVVVFDFSTMTMTVSISYTGAGIIRY